MPTNQYEIVKRTCIAVLWLGLWSSSLAAAKPAEDLLPDSTCVYVSFGSMNDFRSAFEKTKLGELVQDPVMKPFAEDLSNQIRARFGNTQIQLGLKWEDLEGIYGGEACIARIQPDGKKDQHATALLIDVTGHDAQLQKVRKSIDDNMQRRKATKRNQKIGPASVTVHQLPRKLKAGRLLTPEVFSFVWDSQFVVTNHLSVAKGIIQRMGGAGGTTLKANKNFSYVMQQIDAASKSTTPHVRWYLDPFRFAEVARSARSTPAARGNFVTTLESQGFDAIRAVGGYVNLATDDHEFLHRTFVYAPAVTPNSTKFNKAARMLQFPAQEQLPIETWVPRNVATYMSFQWNIPQAFEYAIGMIDQIVDSPGFVEDVLESFKTDKGGPQIDLRKSMLAHLDEKIIAVSDHTMPIGTKSERVMVAILLKDGPAVSSSLKQLWDEDPQAQKREIAKHVVWEIVPEEDDIPELDLPGAVPIPGSDSGSEEDEIKLPNAAMTVADFDGRSFLLVATNISLIADVLGPRPNHDSLGASADFQVVDDLLSKLGAGKDSFRMFSRTDEEFQLAYEMIRQGKMPQSESLLGKALNALLDSEDEVVRKPQVDGKNLPNYEVVRRYLGPGGTFVQPRDDGWMATGIVISKEKMVEKSAEAGADLTAAVKGS